MTTIRGEGRFAKGPGLDSEALGLLTEHDVSTQEGRKKQALADLVYRDDLTGLYNRRYLYPQLDRHLASLGRGAAFTLVMIDLDYFKTVNDKHGHLVGDAVLQELAERLQALLRQDEILVRYAGDEFMILMPGTSKRNAIGLAERLRHDTAKRPFEVGEEHSMQLSLSIGLATAPQDAKSPYELIDACDKAMYTSKERGRNRVTAAGPSAARTAEPHISDLLAGFPCRRLVGRSIALARIESLSNMGEFGPTSLILIQGEAGIGKTRILREMARRRHESQHLTMWAACRAELRSTPYAPLVEILRRWFEADTTLMGEVVSFLSDEDRLALSRRLPQLAIDHAAGTQLSVRNPRAAFFTAVVRILKYLGKERHLCLFLDDIQYADAATLKVISFLLRSDQARQAGIPIFGTVATDTAEAMDPKAGFAEFSRVVSRCATFGTVDLRPLQREHVKTIIDNCFAKNTFPPEFADKLFQVSRGNPLCVEEVLILLALSGFLVPEAGGWRLERRAQLAIPDNLSEILMAHLGKLDEETSRALLKASVIGSRFSVDLLRKVLEINEGRAAQITDKAIKYRLLNQGDPATLEGLTFVNRKIQELTYQIVGDELKREVHRKVAGVKESADVVDLDEALAEISHHYDKSGDRRRGKQARQRLAERSGQVWRADESEEYFEVAGKIVAPRVVAEIAEATIPLADEQLVLVPAVMKGLIAVQRGIQMYPPGSRFIAGAIEGCLKAIRKVLKTAETITIKERAGVFEVNGKQYPLDRFGAVAQQLVDDFRKSLVHSITFTRAVSARDVETLCVGMLTFGERGSGGDWKEFMVDRGARGAGVVPKRFRATADGASALHDAQLEGLARESRRHLPMLQAVLRFTAAAAEAVQLYPRGSDTVKRALEGLVAAFAECHKVLKTVNMGVTADGFLVNDLRVEVRTFGPGVQVMRELFDRNEVFSVSFHRGIEAAELEALFRYLSKGRGLGPDATDWSERLGALGIAHVGIDEYTFVAADAQGGGRSEPQQGSADTVRIDRNIFLAKIFEGQPADLLEPQVKQVLPGLLTDLILDGDDKLPREIVAKVFQNMDAPEPHLRVQALELVSEVMEGTSHVVAGELLDYTSAHVAQCLSEERAPAPLARLILLGESASARLLSKGDLRTASRILWQLGKGIQSDDQVDPDSRRASENAISRIMHSSAFQQALSTLWTPNEKRRTLALHMLESCGRRASERLLQLVVDSPDDKARGTFAAQLKAVADPDWLEETLSSAITPDQSPQRARNVLVVVDLLINNVFPLLVRAFQHTDSTVIAEAIKLLHRLGPDDRKTVLGALLRIPERGMRLRAVVLIGDLRPSDMAPKLIELLDKEQDDREVSREICNTLGRLGDIRAVPPLVALLRSTRWTRFLKRDPPLEVRVAAIWALGNFRVEAARAALEQARTDHSERVRQSAEAVLAAASPVAG